jgi:hypothetical protein
VATLASWTADPEVRPWLTAILSVGKRPILLGADGLSRPNTRAAAGGLAVKELQNRVSVGIVPERHQVVRQ